jgi:hypothetical protein
MIWFTAVDCRVESLAGGQDDRGLISATSKCGTGMCDVYATCILAKHGLYHSEVYAVELTADTQQLLCLDDV